MMTATSLDVCHQKDSPSSETAADIQNILIDRQIGELTWQSAHQLGLQPFSPTLLELANKATPASFLKISHGISLEISGNAVFGFNKLFLCASFRGK
jgi:hypothetical protein